MQLFSKQNSVCVNGIHVHKMYLPYEGGVFTSRATASPSLYFGQDTLIYSSPFFPTCVARWKFSLKCRLAKMCLKCEYWKTKKSNQLLIMSQIPLQDEAINNSRYWQSIHILVRLANWLASYNTFHNLLRLTCCDLVSYKEKRACNLSTAYYCIHVADIVFYLRWSGPGCSKLG